MTDIDSVIESFGIRRLTKTPHGYRGCCDVNPNHVDTKPSMYINLEKGMVKCFSCGGFKTLFAYLTDKGVDFNIAVDFLLTGMNFSGKRDSSELTEYVLGRDIPKSMLDRGFLPSTLKHFGVGYDSFEKRITIPLKFNGKLYGIGYRAYPKKFWATANFVKDNFIYNYEQTDTRVLTEGFCFDGNTEVFTEDGWKFFKDYKSEKVYQVTDNFRLELVTPYKITKEKYTGDMIEYNSSIFSSKTTGNHNMVGIRKDRVTPEKRFARDGFPSNYSIPTKVILNGAGINQTDEELLLQVAIKADATIRIRKTDQFNYAYFNLKKDRKKSRLIKLLEILKIDYKTTKCGRVGWTDISFRIPKHYTKYFDNKWLFDSSLYQKRLILNEVSFWDGHRPKSGSRTEYYTINYSDAVFIQTLAHLSNMKANIYSRPNTTKNSSVIHRVNILWQSKETSYASLKKKSYEVIDKMVYCTSVPSGMLLVRKNGFIYVCGNTDTWRIWQNGTKNVSSLLTAYPSDGQLELLSVYKTLILALDNDKAGFMGAFRLNKELGRDIDIKILKFSGKDVGDLTKEQWQKCISDVRTFSEFEVALIMHNPKLYEELEKKFR